MNGISFHSSNRTPSASHSLSSSPKGGAEGASRRGVCIKPGVPFDTPGFGYRDYFAFKIFINSSPVMVSCS